MSSPSTPTILVCPRPSGPPSLLALEILSSDRTSAIDDVAHVLGLNGVNR